MDEVEELIGRFEMAIREHTRDIEYGTVAATKSSKAEADEAKLALTKALTVSPEKLEVASRAICATIPGGFCECVGGNMGCKVGRGESFNGTNCAAKLEQLQCSREWEAARAAAIALGLRCDP